MSFSYETHMHTSEGSGCGRNTGAEQVRAYKKRGYAGIIITDHFINGYSSCPRGVKMPWEKKMDYVMAGYNAAKAEGDRVELDVFFGWEYTIRGSDFLTYGLDHDFLLAHPDLDKLEIEEYSKIVRENGGFLAQAHPYRDRPYIQNKLPVEPQYMDAVEVYNASDNDDAISNGQSLAFAKKNNLPQIAGGDSHGISFTASGIVLENRAESIFDIIDAIKAKKVSLIT